MGEAYFIRPAHKADYSAIRSLVWKVKINPLGLDWQRFLVAVDEAGNILGCGQIKPHKDSSQVNGVRELASIAVQPECQGQGIGSAIVRRLIQMEPGPLYLMARSRLGPYYQRFGFTSIADEKRMPDYFRRISKLSRLLHRSGLFSGDVLVMVRRG
jgi:N-acetylglutamate synthase-like GNAT family acetyltransferase